MSKIQKELCDAAEIDPKRDEERQAFLLRLAKGANGLPDAVWDALSQDAQKWMNDAVDAISAKKPVPEFPDADPPASNSGRRRVVAEDGETWAPKVKDDVKITTKRGKVVTGKILELDKELIVLKTPAGDEEELPLDRIEKIEPLGGKADPAEEGPRDPVKGDTVTVTTKRGKVVTGELLVLSEEEIVLKVDGAEEEFARDRVESIKIEGGRSSSRPAADSGSGRRGMDSDKKDPPANDGKRTRASNGEISVGTRIRELIIEDLSRSSEDIGKILKKEGLEFKENTLNLNYNEAHKLIDMLKKAGKLK